MSWSKQLESGGTVGLAAAPGVYVRVRPIVLTVVKPNGVSMTVLITPNELVEFAKEALNRTRPLG